MKRILLFLLSAAAYACTQAPAASDYAIVAGPGIADDPQWSAVVEALRESHPGARVIRYRDSVREALPALRGAAPATWPSWTGPNASGATTSSSSTA